MKFLKWFSIIVVILIAAGFLLYEHLKPQYHTPKLNPHPSYFLTVEGAVAPQFRGVGHLVFMASYSATKDPCFHETNILAGMVEAESRTKYYWITPDKNNHYKIKVPIDKYQPGICGWIPYTISMDFVENKKDSNQMAFVSIANEGTEKYNPKKITFVCSRANLNYCDIKMDSSKSPVFVIRPTQSYQVQVNFAYNSTIKNALQ